MRSCIFFILFIGSLCSASAQQIINAGNTTTSNNIYTIKELVLEKALQNGDEKEHADVDDDLARFNRWFNLMVPRTYPTGEMPWPDQLLAASKSVFNNQRNASRTTTSVTWQPVGPTSVPTNFNGIGRVNCIVIDPVDTNTIYVGTACGGVWVSHNGGNTWYSNCDNFPSMSIADIAVNPLHTDTVYAATGDGYGYTNGGYNIFWGGLYSAGIMMSADTGHTWTTTGLSYIQSQNDIIQRLLIHPTKTNILLAATTHGIVRSTDAGATWDTVTTNHTYSMAFRPGQPDTVYAIDTRNLIVSYDAGATWTTLYSTINTTNDRCSIAVSPSSPNSIWVLNDANNVLRSYDGGLSFYATTASPSTSASFYGYYDRVLAVSPTDSNYILACGEYMARSSNAGTTWGHLDVTHKVHVDNHAIAINPLHTMTIYTGNDGGIAVTHDGGASWTNLGNGLMISQIYRISTSRQSPYIMLCGLQDNGTFYNDSGTWLQSNAPSGDGMDNAIHPLNDHIQIASYQYGNFFISYNRGASFTGIPFPAGVGGNGQWTTPVVFNPNNSDTIFFGFNTIYASYDGGTSVHSLTSASSIFASGAIALAVAPSNVNTIYASDYDKILRSEDGGVTWTNVSGNLPSGIAKTRIAVDYSNPLTVYITLSGYSDGYKVYKSTVGGTTWTNISAGLPNVPANCIAVDSSSAGGLFIGTDMGVFYRDDTVSSWSPYNIGLPNVIVDDLDINYYNNKVRAATYGRGVWECNLKKPARIHNAGTAATTLPTHQVQLYPNPTTNEWKIVFRAQKPVHFSVRVTDMTGKVLATYRDKELIDASKLVKGIYNIEILADDVQENVQAVKY